MNESPGSNLVGAAAESYRSNGYEIIFDPSKFLLPEPVRTFQPDFIATQGEVHIAVEVKSRASIRDDEEIRKYAELFRSLPGWRLDLVVVPDEPVSPSEPKLLSKQRLRKRLQTSDALFSEYGDTGGAIILLWTAIEAFFRAEIDDAHRFPIMPGARLVKEALSLGLISQKEWKELDHLVRLRNQVAHGEAPNITNGIYKTARSIAARLIEDGP